VPATCAVAARVPVTEHRAGPRAPRARSYGQVRDEGSGGSFVLPSEQGAAVERGWWSPRNRKSVVLNHLLACGLRGGGEIASRLPSISTARALMLALTCECHRGNRYRGVGIRVER